MKEQGFVRLTKMRQKLDSKQNFIAYKDDVYLPFESVEYLTIDKLKSFRQPRL